MIRNIIITIKNQCSFSDNETCNITNKITFIGKYIVPELSIEWDCSG